LLAGERFVKEVGDVEVLVLRAGNENFAISNICSHEEVWLDDGIVDEESCQIECPMHEGRFDLRTGAATHEPAEEPIATFALRIEGDDVFVELPDSET
jgi:nitrite reductase/ring-hydroxylating ferredoxin subunit